MPHDLLSKSDPVIKIYPPASGSSRKAIDAAFDISQSFENGFLFVGDAPLPILLPSTYTAWEDALARAKALPLKLNDPSTAAEAWRQSVRELPVISIKPLKTDLRLLNLARGVLTFLQHFYIHSLPDAKKSPHVVIPASIAVPLLAVSRAVDLPPVMTFADCNFYNFRLGEAKGAEHDKANREILVQHTFSQTTDEMHFYLSGLLIEREGVRSVHAMGDLVQHFAEDSGRPVPKDIALFLQALAGHINAMGTTLDALRGTCAPEVFYNDVRPWFVGANKEVPWVFEVDDSADAKEALEGNRWLKRGEGGVWIADDISGTTAAQSTIIQALDVFLGIDAVTHERPDVKNRAGAKAKPQGNFLARMRDYLPLAHREFFEVLAPHGLALRVYIKETRDKELSDAYGAAIAALQRFRTIHVRIATLYIINQMRRTAPKGEVLGTVQTEKEARGTGGTTLMPFLKGIRDRTGESTLGGSSVEYNFRRVETSSPDAMLNTT